MQLNSIARIARLFLWFLLIFQVITVAADSEDKVIYRRTISLVRSIIYQFLLRIRILNINFYAVLFVTLYLVCVCRVLFPICAHTAYRCCLNIHTLLRYTLDNGWENNPKIALKLFDVIHSKLLSRVIAANSGRVSTPYVFSLSLSFYVFLLLDHIISAYVL